MLAQNLTLSHKMALALLFCTAGIVLLYLLRPIADPDFFWHLKTGQWILEHRELPEIDPFSLAPPPIDNLRASFILTSYWFSQVIYASLFALGGWWGIVLLRVALVGVIGALFASRVDLRQPAKVCLLLLVTVQILEVYPLERPQVFSFVFFTALLVLMEYYREREESDSKTGLFVALVAVLMLFWSNMHGGFLLGQLILMFYLVMEGVKFFHPSLSPLSRRCYGGLAMIVLAGLVASLFNPNPINSFKILFMLGDTETFLFATNMEYSSSLKYFREHRDYSIILNWLMIILVVCRAVITMRRADITWLALLAVTAFMGCQNVRYMPFFLVAAFLFLGKGRYTGTVGTMFKTVLIVSTFISVLWFSRDEVQHVPPIIHGQFGVDQSFPVSAADFSIQKKLPDPIYNTYLWGGYLLWRLGPERKIYSDGRVLDVNRFWEYLSSTLGTSSNNPYWKEIFRKNGIQTAIVQIIEPSGQINPLVNSLRRDKDWIMVFAKDNAAVFIRKGNAR